MTCVESQIAEDCCYVRFGASPGPGNFRSSEAGQTVRGEGIIADFDAERRIIGWS